MGGAFKPQCGVGARPLGNRPSPSQATAAQQQQSSRSAANGNRHQTAANPATVKLSAQTLS